MERHCEIAAVTVRVPADEAPDGHAFAQGAFDAMLGRLIPFTWKGNRYVDGTLAAVEIPADGSSADLTFTIGGQLLRDPDPEGPSDGLG